MYLTLTMVKKQDATARYTHTRTASAGRDSYTYAPSATSLFQPSLLHLHVMTVPSKYARQTILNPLWWMQLAQCSAPWGSIILGRKQMESNVMTWPEYLI